MPCSVLSTTFPVTNTRSLPPYPHSSSASLSPPPTHVLPLPLSLLDPQSFRAHGVLLPSFASSSPFLPSFTTHYLPPSLSSFLHSQCSLINTSPRALNVETKALQEWNEGVRDNREGEGGMTLCGRTRRRDEGTGGRYGWMQGLWRG